MAAKKNTDIYENSSIPYALIIGGDYIADFLAGRLIQNNCDVTRQDFYSPKLGMFDYIFQFGNFDITDDAIDRHLNFGGKFLFIEGEKEEDMTPDKRIKILRIGAPFLWEKNELIEKILSTAFTVKNGTITDLRKKPKTPQPQITQPNIIIQKPPKTPSILPIKKTTHLHLVEKKPHLSFSKFLILLFMLIIIVISSTALYIYWHVQRLNEDFKNFRLSIASSRWEDALSNMKNARGEISKLQMVYKTGSYILFPIRDMKEVKDVGVILSVSDDLLANTSEVINIFPMSIQNSVNFSQINSSQESGDLSKIIKRLKEFEKIIILAKTQIDETKNPFIPKDTLTQVVNQATEKIISVNKIIDVIQPFILSDTPKTYLVLFQNNMELRPTGGFIGSYGLITFEKNKIKNFSIEDVYTADGQLRGHVEPPLPIKKYLAQPHYFLRDSNFDPDFAVTARQSAWFLQKEMNINVNGVIGVNLFVIQDVLKVIGSLKLPDFANEEITSDNFIQKAQFHSQDKFFPGSSQKKDFLRSVANAILTHLTTDNSYSVIDIFPLIKKDLEEKNILLASFDNNIQRKFENQGLGGRINEIKCIQNKDNCLADYIGIIEANLGVNKANFYINKSVDLTKEFDQNGNLNTTVKINYENNAIANVQNDSQYVNYVRFYLPSKINIKNISINNMNLSAGDITSEPYEGDKASVGFLIRINPSTKAELVINYTMPSILKQENKSYELFYQKQSGDKTSPLIVKLKYPASSVFLSDNFKSYKTSDNTVFYTTDTSVDRVFNFQIQR